ncbi:uncharacterized protein LOC131027275 [Cryptomeria japonica]|uniref:uncharacterized protein LOC131027275 n=1 Tax=Cryptomeria japonica TaxID=3369 RepID=UPI0027DA9498|nr:uncharacterized protein LOC131027275 [Cryptomeria japonica]
MEKLKLINREVKGWNKATFGDIFKKKKVLGFRLEQLQSIMATGNPPDPILMEEEECHKSWKDILSKEEVYWKKRSRIHWLKEGDRNLAFFHRSTYIHRRRNYIKSLRDDSDQEITGDSLIKQSATEFFIGLYMESGRNDVSLQDSLLSKLLNVIEEDDNYQLTTPISLEEVHLAAFAMGAYKTPGPNGFPSAFFQDYWDIAGGGIIHDQLGNVVAAYTGYLKNNVVTQAEGMALLWGLKFANSIGIKQLEIEGDS